MSICNIDNTYKFSYLYGIRAPTLMSISDPIFFFATLISHLLWLLPPTPSFKSQPSITSRSNSLQLISQYGDSIPIKMIIDKGITTPNPTYIIWYRQDQIISHAILGSYFDVIQPMITSSTTSMETQDRLSKSYASQSRSRIMSFKSILAKYPKGNHPFTEFFNDIRLIFDEIALV